MMTRPCRAADASRIWALSTSMLGAVTVIRPDAVASFVSGGEDLPNANVVRLLGTRQLVQGIVLGLRPLPLVIAGAITVDVLHAISMVGLTAVRPAYRRSALASAATAAASAAAGILVSHRRAVRTGPPAPPVGVVRDLLSHIVARRLPG